ncbi:MAG: DUF3106 domain-containing protein [Rhodoferax sp.]|nr:DUF3106 domain-containing protein [Rhodoferax sp.]
MQPGLSKHLIAAFGSTVLLTALIAPAGAAQATNTGTKGQTETKLTPLEWSGLTPLQHQALQPLASSWKTLSESQKKKWIALSSNYTRLPPADQQKLHQRMAHWATLTPKQRTQARLNFAQTQQMPLEDKAERWEVYQTFTPEQKKVMADSAPKLPLAPKVAKAAPPARAASVRRPASTARASSAARAASDAR